MSIILAGQKMVAEDFRDQVDDFAYKISDQGPVTNNTIQNDDHLFHTLEANGIWQIGGMLVWTCASATPDIQIGFDIPSGAAMRWYGAAAGTNLASQLGSISSYAPNGTGTVFLGTNDSATYPSGMILTGMVETGSTPGTLQLKWSQVTTNANGVTMNQYSYTWIRRRA